MKQLLITSLLLLSSVAAQAITITQTQGWRESGSIQWNWEDGSDYSVYCRPEGGTYTQLDPELVRHYPGYGRADVVGLSAGNYQLKVVTAAGDAAESPLFAVTAHDRCGFAHYGRTEGVGAYNNDGTLKDNARVLYVTANNAKTVSLDMMVGSGKTETRTGLQNIIKAYEKSAETRPLAVRIIGTIKGADMDDFGSAAEGLQVKGGGSAKCVANLTIEGIGQDATIHGFGILCRSISSVEFRNFAIMICLDDCLSLDTDNRNIWIHNMDFFYGGTGSDSDQAKGDGTVDIKGKSSHVTVSYNHFYDSGKCSLGGMKSETTDCWMTYHHNWFDHSDSRHPRIRTAFYHVVNNYFDGNSKYGTGVTMGGSAFCESNYYRNVKYPFLISRQGTDAEGDGTFSGEAGGVIKVFGNYVKNPRQVLYYDGRQTDGCWDAVRTSSREEQVTATAYSGGTAYNNAATTEAIQAVPVSAIDPVDSVPAIVRGTLGAGRINHGDFHWTFLNSVQDVNSDVVPELKSALLSYQSTLIGLADGTVLRNGGATATVDGGDGMGISQEQNDAYVPSWGSGGDAPEEPEFEEEPYIASADGTDFYWVGDTHVEQTRQYIADGIILLGNSQATNPTTGEVYYSKFAETYAGNATYVSEHVGSLQLGQASAAGTYNGGTATFYCPQGASTFRLSVLRTGNTYYIVQKSTDGLNYTRVGGVEKGASGISEKDFSSAVRDLTSTDPVWIRVVNGSTGGLHIFGVQICQQVTEGDPRPALLVNDLQVAEPAVSLNVGETAQTSYTSSSTAAVNYATSNAAVATVSATGIITAVGAGTATITLSQAKDDTYRAGVATITVTVTDPNGGADPVDPTDPGETLSEAVICSFSASAKAPSSPMVSVTGNYSNSKGTVTYGGKEYTDCVKMESSTIITIKPTAHCKVTLIFGGSTDAAGKKIRLDDLSVTLDAAGQHTFDAQGGKTYTLKKGDSINLFLILFEPEGTALSAVIVPALPATTFTLDGRPATPSAPSGLRIQQGKKYIVK